MDLKHFYTALGRVVYAVAKADGAVQHEEVASVFHFVITQIIEIEKNNFDGRHALEAFYTEKEFNRLRDEDVSMIDAFDQFIGFYNLNKDVCDTNMKNTCLHIIEKVALAHNGIEPAELAIIENVKKIFSEE